MNQLQVAETSGPLLGVSEKQTKPDKKNIKLRAGILLLQPLVNGNVPLPVIGKISWDTGTMLYYLVHKGRTRTRILVMAKNAFGEIYYLREFSNTSNQTDP